MTIWHFKAELLRVDGASATYRFFPDHVMAPVVSGVFRVNLTTFEAEVLDPANAEARGLVSTDQYCVAALVHKIRRVTSTQQDPPKEIFFVA